MLCKVATNGQTSLVSWQRNAKVVQNKGPSSYARAPHMTSVILHFHNARAHTCAEIVLNDSVDPHYMSAHPSGNAHRGGGRGCPAEDHKGPAPGSSPDAGTVRAEVFPRETLFPREGSFVRLCGPWSVVCRSWSVVSKQALANDRRLGVLVCGLPFPLSAQPPSSSPPFPFSACECGCGVWVCVGGWVGGWVGVCETQGLQPTPSTRSGRSRSRRSGWWPSERWCAC